MSRTLSSLVVVVVALVLPVSASRAAAQTLFVDGAVFASTHWPGEPEPVRGMDGGGLDGTVVGGGFAVGTWLTPRLSVRLETGWPGERSDTISGPGYAVPMPAALAALGLPFPGYPLTIEVSQRMRTVAPLLAFHTARHHGVQLAYVGGAAFAWQQTRTTGSIYWPLYDPIAPFTSMAGGMSALPAGLEIINGRVPRMDDDENISTRYLTAAVVGVGGDIRLTRRLSVVPQVRALVVGGGLNLRSGVAVRVNW